jgi:glucokinase
VQADKPIAVIGAGTGLGEALALHHGGRLVVMPTEGGHATLAALDDREAALLAWLRARHEHVSAERVLAGPGLGALHAAIAALDGVRVPERDAAAILAARHDCPVAAATVAQFLAFLGAFAGDVALIQGARGGVFLGGGILPRIADALPGSALRARFEAKGRMRGYVAPIPLAVILRDDAALKGLAALP